VSVLIAVGAVRTWVALYTLGLPRGVRDERRTEIDCDLYEQRLFARFEGEGALSTAGSISMRLVLGMLSDIMWRVQAGLLARSNRSTNVNILFEAGLPNIAHRGKVRDTYDLGERLLIVATDRISAFDVVLPSGIPGKGAVLTQLSAFWFERTTDVVPNHFLRIADGSPDDDLPFKLPQELIGRSMIVREAERLDVECIVRGYMTGSAWSEYQEHGTVCGVRMPPGIKESEPFPEPLFTPTTKAEVGHDENMSMDQYADLLGLETANAVRLRSLALYKYAAQFARERGIIIADTKFEFGIVDGEPIVIDEVLTPDSSRFWDAEAYAPGKHQEAFDKQYVRDYLLQSAWDREPPGPELPRQVLDETARRYREIYRRLTGEEIRL
jgi:phosphoribosylaminoimidazole-succinocarboxamide synthase